MSEQRPLGSGFGPATTAEEAAAGVDLSGKIAVVTGGYSGLGLVTAKTLADRGAEVIVPARDMDKARQSVGGDARLKLEPMDLLGPASIDAFADRFLASSKPLHLLINNAAIMAAPLMRDARGYEAQFSTNHLGHFQLTARLWPAIERAGAGARVVAVSSSAHTRAGVDLDDPNFERRAYDPWESYGQSKTANVLFALELDRRASSRGVRAYSLHPGGISTNLGRFTPREHMQAFGIIDAEGKPIIDPENGKKTPEQGAATIVWCAVSPQLEGIGGVYCENCDVAAPATEGRGGVRPWAIDPDAARRLWTLSEKLTGKTLLDG
jgi:NAD(P)-dependent dehydrogenase (short-subunit alcohol dehydrogenase family)